MAQPKTKLRKYHKTLLSSKIWRTNTERRFVAIANQKIYLNQLTNDDQKAFFINLYNGLQLAFEKILKKRQRFFTSKQFVLEQGEP
jgi:hypothetical protein